MFSYVSPTKKEACICSLITAHTLQFERHRTVVQTTQQTTQLRVLKLFPPDPPLISFPRSLPVPLRLSPPIRGP